MSATYRDLKKLWLDTWFSETRRLEELLGDISGADVTAAESIEIEARSARIADEAVAAMATVEEWAAFRNSEEVDARSVAVVRAVA